MWLSFVIAVLACLVFLYAPGFLFFYALGNGPVRSLVLAPIVSVAAYGAMGIVLPALGISCSWISVFFTVLVLCAVFFVVRMLVRQGVRLRQNSCVSWPTLGIYLIVGAAVGVYMYVIPLGSPDAFLQEYDNAFHMETIRAFVDSGNWSVLSVSKYIVPQDQAIAPLPGSSFYPALWHIVCSLIVSALGCPVALAINATNYVISSILFPTGMMLILSTVLKDRSSVRLGAIISLAFLGFPWLILYWGPLYANVFAFALIPSVSSVFLRIVNSIDDHCVQAVDIIVFAIGVFVLVVAQTSSVFTCVVLLAPYCVYRLWSHEGPVHFGKHPFSQKASALIFALLVMVIWTALVFAPFMHGLVFNSEWGPTRTLGDALLGIATMRFGWFAMQPVLAALTALGIVYSIRHREYLWITVAYLIFCVLYLACVTDDGFARHYFAGFWYSDSYRIVACLALAGIPLATLGFGAVLSLVKRKLPKEGASLRIVPAAFIVLVAVLLYLPSFSIGNFKIETALGKIQEEYFGGNHNEIHSHHVLLDADEEDFLFDVADIVGTDDLVINMPDDGSAFAYAVNGLRTYYRDYRSYDGGHAAMRADRPFETQESKLIRKYGAWYESNDEVRDALERVGARYVLVLDDGDSFEKQHKVPSYDPALWLGLTAISDETPGFDLVLSRGDMRLYEITGLSQSL